MSSDNEQEHLAASNLLECGTSLAESEHYTVNKDSPTHLSTGTRTRQANKNRSDLSSIESLRNAIADDVLTEGGPGEYTMFTSPFEISSKNGGARAQIKVPLVYCDHTASNRPCFSIERYMQKTVLPLYGNTHTNTSITGRQSTAFVAEARQIVAEETNAKITGKASLDVVLFTGSGATSAVELFIDCLSLKEAARDQATRPVIFVGPYEHHSNLIPWRETGSEIVMIPESAETNTVDLAFLEVALQQPAYANRTKIGTFTAASNVTGKVCDVPKLAATLHRYGALACIDYATASSYVKIDMNPVPSQEYPSASLLALDAVFLSPHKMLGGVGAAGVLIVKKHLVSQVNAPSRSGGGTVFYVTSTHHRFLSNRIERYEGGTPNVPGIVRCGLAFLLKRSINAKYQTLKDNAMQLANSLQLPASIQQYEYMLFQKVCRYLRDHAPNLILLDSHDEKSNKLPIFSFLIRFGDRFLHYNFVCAVLNDVFGIQSRGGCQCAGPYSQKLLGLSTATAQGDIPNSQNESIEEALYRFKERAELLRPGYTRLSLPFKGMKTDEQEYVLKALVWVAKNGWALMPHYRCNHKTGEWRHASRQGKPFGKNEKKWLSHYDVSVDQLGEIGNSNSDNCAEMNVLDEALSNADRILSAAKSDKRSISEALKMVEADLGLGKDDDSSLEELRWYVYPKQCAVLLQDGIYEQPVSNRIFGSLNPLSRLSDLVASTENNNQESTCNRKRKPSTSIDRVGSNPATTNWTSSKGAVLVFRDGEHTGEAEIGEIIEGVADGELSESCEVFDNSCGEWVPFASICTSETFQTPRQSNVVATTDKKAARESGNWGGVALELPRTLDSVAITDSHSDVKPAVQPIANNEKKQRFRHVKPPPKLMRLATQAVMQWEMIQEGDKLLLGLSGGKDSLSLLHCLLELKRKLPVRFELEVCTIDPMTPSFDPSPLIPYVESLGLKYHFVRDEIVARAEKSGENGKMVSSLCAYCARMKRGNLYSCARRNNCNKLVLAQHLDDCAESVL